MTAEIAENPEIQNLKAESEGKDKVTGRKPPVLGHLSLAVKGP